MTILCFYTGQKKLSIFQFNQIISDIYVSFGFYVARIVYQFNLFHLFYSVSLGNVQITVNKPCNSSKVQSVSFQSCFFFEKKKDIKWAAGVCVCVCVCGVSTVLFPPNNFQTSYPINTKFWLHTVSYRNSPTPLIPFLNLKIVPGRNF